MNLSEMISKNLKESDFNGIAFEKNIPYEMRFKQFDTVNEDKDLYWVTQDVFDTAQMQRFQEALKNTRFDKAFVTVRDLSSYDFNRDLDNAVLVIIPKEGQIDCDNYLKTVNEKWPEDNIQ